MSAHYDSLRTVHKDYSLEHCQEMPRPRGADSQSSVARFFTMWSLLYRYLKVYWLKPFDAVNDTANAWALRQFRWEEPILEIGGGDGVFSFILHGGEFSFSNDRYDQCDPKRAGDIFDVYCVGSDQTIKRYASRSYKVGVDLKWSHLLKCKETKLYENLVAAEPDVLPFRSNLFNTVFLYFPHGLMEKGEKLDYENALKEIGRVLQPKGSLIMTAVNKKISKYFVCHSLACFFENKKWRGPSEYFKKLDAGRYKEISGLGLGMERWTALLKENGFNLIDLWDFGKPIAWQFCELQTRPFLKTLIRTNWFLKKMHLKKWVKAAWVYTWLPLLMLFFQLFAKPRDLSFKKLGENLKLFFIFRSTVVKNQ